MQQSYLDHIRPHQFHDFDHYYDNWSTDINQLIINHNDHNDPRLMAYYDHRPLKHHGGTDINDHNLTVHTNDDIDTRYIFEHVDIDDIGAVRIDYDGRTYHLVEHDDDVPFHDDDDIAGGYDLDDVAGDDLDRLRNDYIDAHALIQSDANDDDIDAFDAACAALVAALQRRR